MTIDPSETMTIDPPISRNNSEGSIALRNFFDELFEERAGERSDGESDTFDSDSVNLSSDDETATTRIDLTKKNGSTRRHRSRHSTSRKQHFRSLTISPDNAAGIRRGSKTELMCHSYHNPSTGSILARRYSLSTSLHSLGSLTEISANSVGSWRSSLHKHRSSLKGRQAVDRKKHKDMRWSTGPLDKSKNSRNKVKQYDFGFVNDSYHLRNNRRSKKNQRTNMVIRTNSSKPPRTNNRKGFSSRVIEKAVRLVNDVSSSEDESSEGEEFFEDDEESLASLTESFVSSRANTTISSPPKIGSSLDFGSRYKKKAKAVEFSPRVAPSRTRVAPLRTKSDLPRLPRRTKDDLFFKLEDTFESLRGNSSSQRGGFQKPKMRRSLSDDVSNLRPSIKVPKRRPDPGRWIATITTNKDSDSPNNDSVMKTPRRTPSLSSKSNSSKKKSEGKPLKASSRSTGRNSNHSNDSSGPSDSDSDCDLHNSFAYDDVSPTKSNQSSSTESSFEKDGAIKFLLRSSSAHSRKLSIPDSLLPHHSYHGRSTISTNVSSRGKRQHPGKSLRTTSRA